MGAVVAPASLAGPMDGPHWFVENTALSGSQPITFKNNGNTRLVTAEDEILCEKAEQTGVTGNEIIGGSPGAGKANIKFTLCTVIKPGLGCEVRSKTTGTPFGTIEINLHTELVYLTKAAGEAEKAPLGVLFKTAAASNKKFVELEFTSLCVFGSKLVEATGEEHGPGIAGVAGLVCEAAEKAEVEKVSHEINCIEKKQQKFFYWGSGVLKEGKAGLKLSGEVAEQIGKGTIEAGGKAYSARGE